MARVAQVLGRWGEQVAVDHLEADGMRVLARNWRCREGELDVVAWDPSDQALVFCEVKTRSGPGFGGPAESVTPAKVRRLRRLAASWLAGNEAPRGALRFDVVEVVRDRRAPVEVRHLRQVV